MSRDTKPILPITQGDETRFWEKVQRGPGCWEWQAATNSRGYGDFGLHGVAGGTFRAHRVAWTISRRREIPAGQVVRHLCHNRLCVRPDHLTVGTDVENAADKSRAGRHPVGEETYNAKLNESEVAQILLLARTGRFTTVELGHRFGVCHQTISDIASRKKWSHIDDPLPGAPVRWRQLRGEEAGNAKLTEDDVRAIIGLRESGWHYRQIAAMFPCTRQNIRAICIGKTWNHVTGLARRVRTGSLRGEQHHQAKVTEDTVRAIRSGYEDGVPAPELAKRFGLSRYAAWRIATRRSWTHVT